MGMGRGRGRDGKEERKYEVQKIAPYKAQQRAAETFWKDAENGGRVGLVGDAAHCELNSSSCFLFFFFFIWFELVFDWGWRPRGVFSRTWKFCIVLTSLDIKLHSFLFHLPPLLIRTH